MSPVVALARFAPMRRRIVGRQRDISIGGADAGVDIDVAAGLHGNPDAVGGHSDRIGDRDVVVRLQHHVGCRRIDRGGRNRLIGARRVGELIDLRQSGNAPGGNSDIQRIEQKRSDGSIRRQCIDLTGETKVFMSRYFDLTAVSSCVPALGEDRAAKDRILIRPYHHVAGAGISCCPKYRSGYRS